MLTGGRVSGYIIQDDGYRWTFGVCAIFFGILMFAVIFFVPETAYRRDSLEIVPADTSSDLAAEKSQAIQHSEHAQMTLGHEHDRSEGHEKHLSYSVTRDSVEPKNSYVKSLRVFTGRYTYSPIWKIFLRPLVFFFYPAVLWGFLIYGTSS